MADLQAPAAPGPGGADVADVFLSYSRADTVPCCACSAQLKDAGLADLPRPRPAPRRPALAPRPGAGHRALRRRRRLPRPRRARHLAAARGPARPRPPGRGGAAGAHLPGHPRPPARDTDPPGGFLRLNTWVDLRADPTTRPSSSSCWPASAARPPPGPALARGHLPLSRPARLPRGGCRPVLRPRGRDGRASGQGPGRAAGHAGRPLRQRQVVGGPGRPDPAPCAAAPTAAAGPILTLRPGAEPLHALVRTFIRRWPKALLREATTSLRSRSRSCARTPAPSAAASAPSSPTRRSRAPTASCSMSTSGRSSTPRPCATRPTRSRPRPTSSASSTSCSTPPAPAPAPSSSPPAPTSTATSSSTRRCVQTVVNLGPMERADLEAAIRKPAEAVRLTVDQPLVDELAGRGHRRSRQAPPPRIRAEGNLAAAASPAASPSTPTARPAASTVRSPSAPTTSTTASARPSRQPPAACSSASSRPAKAARTPARASPTPKPRRPSVPPSRPSATPAPASWSPATRPPPARARSRSATRR